MHAPSLTSEVARGELRRRAAGALQVRSVLGAMFDAQRQVADAALTNDERRIAVLCSRRAGKSWLVAAIMVCACLRQPFTRCIWLGLTQRSIQRIAIDVMRKIKAKHRVQCKFSLSAHAYRFPNGSTIELDGPGDQPLDFGERYLGAPYSVVTIDEAGSFSPSLLDFLVNVVFRPALVEHRGTLITPGTPREHYSGLYYDSTRGVLPDWAHYSWGTEQNPAMAEVWAQELAEMLAANPDVKSTPWYQREFEGKWTRDGEKLVYGSFTPAALVYQWAPHPLDQYTLIVDPGYADAAAFLVAARNSNTMPGQMLVLESAKQVRLRTDEIAARIARYRTEYRNLDIIADPTWTVSADLRGPMHGNLPIRSARKDKKWAAISDLNGGFARGNVRVLYHANTGLIDELEKLPIRKKPDGTVAEDKDACDNHLCDCLLYGYRDCRDELVQYQVPKETHEQRARRIDGAPRNWRRTG